MRSILIILFSIVASAALAQEVKCRVSVNGTEIQGVDRTIFQEIGTTVQEFVNGRVWTKNVYGESERIEINYQIQITGVSGDNYQATLQVQSNRPVYGTSYSSLMFNFVDKNFQFAYTQGTVMDFSENTFTSNLSSVIAFYTYILIGLDYDSFSLNGGTEYFQKAEAIVNNAQGSEYSGWKSSEKSKDNRYWMAEGMLNASFAELRQASYFYHRQGFDVLSEKPEDGRTKINEAIGLIENVNKVKPGDFMIQLFFYAKSRELISFYGGVPDQEKTRIVPILKKLDISNATKYDELLKSK
jgi:hypothetical protein